jgi:hypothetical protein
MIFSTTSTIKKALDYVDCNIQTTSKRRDAYVTERYFESDILPLIAKGNTSMGWCYTKHKHPRHWFKVIPNIHKDSPKRDIDRLLIKQLKKQDHLQKFYGVFVENNTINIREFIDKGDKMSLRRLDDCSSVCNIEEMNNEMKKLSSFQEHSNPFSSKWLKTHTSEDLLSLLLQRLLMNIGLANSFPLDVDAIELNDQQISFHEFKRKTKCPSGCFVINGKTVNTSLLFTILRDCKKAPTTSGTLFPFVEKSLGYVRNKNIQCYGLDLSHLDNYEYCAKNGINYVYTIWDSSNYPDKPELIDLFNQDIKPIKEVNIFTQEINKNSFNGFIFTDGKNSGQFTHKLRVQATLRSDLFKKIQ